MRFQVKNYLLAAVITVGGLCSAQAADLAAPPYTKAPAFEPATNWSGFYLGADAGYGWGRNRHTDNNGGFWTFIPGATQDADLSGAVYGGQLGYNWQFANWVVGLEGQFNGGDLKRTDLSNFFPTIDRLSTRMDFTTTVSARFGYALNNWLPYVKAGYAGAQLKTRNFDIFGANLSHTDWQNGFVVGAGLEHALTSNWIVGVEYNYMDFGKQTFSGVNVLRGGNESFQDHLTVSTVTGRISYKFGGR